MKCPKCGSANIKVSNTRSQGDDKIRRQRTCADCLNIWYTVEVPEMTVLLKDLPPFVRVEVSK